MLRPQTPEMAARTAKAHARAHELVTEMLANTKNGWTTYSPLAVTLVEEAMKEDPGPLILVLSAILADHVQWIAERQFNMEALELWRIFTLAAEDRTHPEAFL